VPNVEAESGPRVLISLCTFNERENLAALIPAIHEVVPQAEVVVVDDNSPDGTGEFVRGMSAENPQIQLVSRPSKLGLGTATLEAFRFAIDRGFDLVVNMDADFSHPPRFIPALIEAASRADVVIGSRYVEGGAIPNWGLRRRTMSWCINTYARLMLGLKTRDNSGAFRCYRVARLKELDLSRVRARGYAFQEEILYRCHRIGCTFAEVPITFEERRFGTTKINWREAVDAVRLLTLLRFERP
jgi:dolichol-phosphate mannosyltransferase